MTKNLDSVSIQAKNPYFSVIIPVRKVTSYLRETIKVLKNSQDKSYEVLVITDAISKTANPASKRNIGAKNAKGKVLVFFDDDSYPDKNYFTEAQKIFDSGTLVACGPQLTPPSDNIRQVASGLLLSSFLGSGGAGVYRNKISSKRYVKDYPSVNFCIQKKLFNKLHGFDESHWPGEDTLLCRKILMAKQKILYTPKLMVYHHRREIGFSFLKQQSRYGLHRGYFAKKYPENSLQIGYFIPSFFTLYLPFSYFLPYPIYLYIFLLTIQFTKLIIDKNNFIASLLSILFIPPTHIVYGLYFVKGFFKKNITFISHKTTKSGNYIGG